MHSTLAIIRNITPIPSTLVNKQTLFINQTHTNILNAQPLEPREKPLALLASTTVYRYTTAQTFIYIFSHLLLIIVF